MQQTKTRRQTHGIRVKYLTIGLPESLMARLRREAERQGISASRLVVKLLRLAWSLQQATGADDEEGAA